MGDANQIRNRPLESPVGETINEALASAELLGRALNSANDAIIAIDLAGTVILWNDAAASRYGFSAEEILGKPLSYSHEYRYLSPEQESEAIEALRTNGRWSGRNVHITHDGRELLVDAAVTVMRDESGVPVGEVAVLRDVEELVRLEAEREQALNELDAEKRRLRKIIDALPIAIGLSDSEGRVLELNAEVDRLWMGRYQPGTVEEYKTYRAWWPDGGQLEPAEWTTARVLGTGEPIYDDIFEIERFDGTHAMVVSSAVPMRNESGELEGVLGYIQDVSERYQRARLSDALNEIAAALHSSLGSDEIFNTALELTRATLVAHTCGIGLREGDAWRVKFVVGAESSRLGRVFSEEELPTATGAYETRKTFITAEASSLPEHAALGRSTAVTTPLVSRDEVIGVFTVLRSARMEFEPAEVHFIEQVASSTALALENAELFGQQLEMAKLNAALARIDTTLHAALEIDEIMERALNYGAAALRADSAAITWREEGGGGRVGFVHGMAADVVGMKVPAKIDRHGAKSAATHEVVVIPDAHEHELIDSELISQFGFRSMIVAPIIMRGAAVATLYFNYELARHDFSEPEELFVSNLASSLSLALDNSALFSEQAERGRLADALNRIDAAINRTLDFEVALDVALPEAAEALNVDSVVLLERAGQGWVVRRTYGADLVEGAEFSGDDLRVGAEALGSRDVATVDDVEGSGHMLGPLAESLGARATMAVPLVHAGSASGLMYFNDHRGLREWQPQEIDFVAAFGAHLALAAENARLFSKEHERACLNEALAEIDTLIHGSMVLSEWMGPALEMVALSIGADSAGMAFRDDAIWTARYEYGFGEDYIGYSFSDEEASFRAHMGEQPTPIITQHPDEEPDVIEWAGKRWRFAENLVAPLFDRGKVFGVLIFNSETRERFDSQHVDFVRKFAASVSLGFENQRLYQEERRSASLARALNSVNEALLSTLSEEEMLERIVAQVSEAAGADVSVLLRPDGEEWVITSVHNLSEGLRGHRLSREATQVLREEARRRSPLLVRAIPEETGRLVERETGLVDARSLMFLPLRVSNQLVGVVIFGYTTPMRFGERENEFAQRMSTAITLALENARLFQTERHIAETLQNTLLVIPHRIPGIDFARIYRPATNATRVGGDFIDAFQLTHRKVAFALGDVSGKGLAAASATAMVRNTLRAHAVEGLPPSIVAAKTGNVLSLFTAQETFVTAFFATLNTKTGCLDYVSAGHPPALVVGTDGEVSSLDVGSPILGAFPDVAYRDGRHVLLPGECLLAYSDGLIEARRDGELFGETRLVEVMRSLAGETPERMVEAVFEAVNAFCGGDFKDDVALLAVARKVQPGSTPADEFEMLF